MADCQQAQTKGVCTVCLCCRCARMAGGGRQSAESCGPRSRTLSRASEVYAQGVLLVGGAQLRLHLGGPYSWSPSLGARGNRRCIDRAGRRGGIASKTRLECVDWYIFHGCAWLVCMCCLSFVWLASAPCRWGGAVGQFQLLVSRFLEVLVGLCMEPSTRCKCSTV